MATDISKKALHEFLLIKCKEQTMDYTKRYRLKGNSPMINKLRAELTSLVNSGGSGEEILKIEARMKDLEEEDIARALKLRKNFKILEDERPSKAFLNLENAKRGYNEVILLNKNNPHFNPNLEESAENPKLVPVTDREGISQEFHQAFTQIYKKQEVDDNAEAIQEFIESGGDTKPMEYLRSKALTQDESNKIEGEITMAELEFALFKKMKGSSAPGIDGFQVNWLRKFWASFKLVTFYAINECYRTGTLTSPLKTGVIRLLRKGQKDPTLTGNYRPISLLSIHYKLASCCITQRLRPLVGKVIGTQQKAYVPGNVIGSCIVNLLNLMEYTARKKVESLILLIDFRKAFDFYF